MVFDRVRTRLATQTSAELMRAAALRVWPLSSLTRGYYSLRFWEPVWRDLINRRARAVPADAAPLDAVSRRVVAALETDGIAMVQVDELLGPGTFARLAAAASVVLRRPDLVAQVASGRSRGLRGKSFQVRAFDDRPCLDLDDPLMALPLAPPVLDIARTYFGMLCRLKSMELWVNLPDESAEPAGSQRWHRDYEDRNLLKIFLYISDVDDGAGPLGFVRTSQIGGPLGHLFPRRPPHGVVPPPGAVERVVPADLIQTCTVPAGTLVFCDTTGLHKGGRCESRQRVAFTATFATHGAIDHDRYELAASVYRRPLSLAARHALGLR